MTRFLGDFTAAVEEHKRKVDPTEFAVYGERFKTAQDLSGMPFLLFANAAVGEAELAQMEVAAAQFDFILSCVADEDHARFVRLMKRKRASVDGLMELATRLVEQFTGGPTSQPSDSDGGQSTTTQQSKDDSSSAESSNPVTVVSSAA